MFFICFSHRLTSISENSPSASSASASVFSRFACAAVFFVSAFLLFALTQFFVCGFSSCFNFFNDLLVSFFEFRLLIPSVCFQFDPFCRVLLSRPCLFYFTMVLRSSDHECCHDTSVVTAHVDHVFGFGIFVVFQVSSLDYDVVDLLLISLWGICRSFDECCKIV